MSLSLRLTKLRSVNGNVQPSSLKQLLVKHVNISWFQAFIKCRFIANCLYATCWVYSTHLPRLNLHIWWDGVLQGGAQTRDHLPGCMEEWKLKSKYLQYLNLGIFTKVPTESLEYFVNHIFLDYLEMKCIVLYTTAKGILSALQWYLIL